jgi:hypothetical protein
VESKDFQLIPNEIIEAWIRGEYYSGDLPSISYQYIGISLALRGWYVYETKLSTEPLFKGIVKIDFKDGELFIGGVRLYTNLEGGRPNLFWMSEFSHFLNENEIIWVYKIFNYDCDHHLFNRYLNETSLTAANHHRDKEHFSLDKDEWNSMLDRIRVHLYDDLKEIEAECGRKKGQIDKGLLHFFIRERRAQYRQIYLPEHTGPPIGGEATYTKVFKL